MSLAVTVLGSSAMYATTERAASGYLLHLDSRRVWLDAGPGTWRNLLTETDHTALDGIMLTHRHPDHTTDVFMAEHARLYGRPEPLDPIPLWAPEETLEHLRGFSQEIDRAFSLRPVGAGDTVDSFGATFRFFRSVHPPETVAVRVEFDGATLAYTSDTGPGFDLDGLAGNADVFICEATLQSSDQLWEGHCSAEQAGEFARAANVGLLLLTHLPPGRDLQQSLDEAQAAAGDLEVKLVQDLQRYEVSK